MIPLLIYNENNLLYYNKVVNCQKKKKTIRNELCMKLNKSNKILIFNNIGTLMD